MLKIADFLAELPQDEHLALSNTVGEGLNQARQPAQCLTDDDEQHMLCAVKGPGNVAGSLHVSVTRRAPWPLWRGARVRRRAE
jgi:hypothetical protein